MNKEQHDRLLKQDYGLCLKCTQWHHYGNFCKAVEGLMNQEKMLEGGPTIECSHFRAGGMNACDDCRRIKCEDRKWKMFTCTRQVPVDDTPIDDLEACYQRPFIPGNSHAWKTPLTWTDTNTPDLRRARAGNPGPPSPEVFEETKPPRDFSEVLDALVLEHGEPTTLDDAYDLVTKAARRVMFNRHHDYGPDNINRHGELGVLVRSDDKLARIGNLLSKKKAKGEPREDAWGDMSNYGKIAVMLLRGWWHLPEPADGFVVKTPERGRGW